MSNAGTGPTTDASPRRNRRRWLRRALWAAGALVALAALLVFVVPPLLPEGFVGRIVAGRMARVLGREATVEGARFSFLSGLRARGISVRERPGFGDGEFLRIGRLTATPRALFAGLHDLAQLDLEDAELCLAHDEQGILNAADLAERPPFPVRYQRLRIADLRVVYRDLQSGGSLALLVPSAEVGPVERGRRPVRLGARLATGGSAMLLGEVVVTPADQAFEQAHGTVVVRSLALAPLAAKLRLGRPLPASLAGVALDAEFALDAQVERRVWGNGTLTLTGLPEAPPLGLVGPLRSVVATLRGELSALRPHFDLHAVTQPSEAVRLDASLRQIVADGSVPSFSMDNYILTVNATARADFARGGLPGTALVAGHGSLDASLAGTMAEARLACKAALEQGAAADGDATRPVPPIAFDLDGTFSLAALTAQLSRLALRTEGVSVAASGAARPRPDAELRVAPDGSLPPMTGEASLEAALDFGRWPDGLRLLAGLPSGRPASGTLAATGKALLDGDCRYTLDIAMDRVPLGHDTPLATRLPFLDLVSVVAGGEPEAMDFVASLKAACTAQGASGEAIRSSFAGKGELNLSRLRLVGSPLFRLLADWSGHPELRDVAFERVDAPFTLAGGRCDATATLPFGGGAFTYRGHSTREGGLRYTMHVRDPRQVAFLPRDALEYLEADLPLMHITGPFSAPAARIPIEAILQFNLLRRRE
ncbi:MAG TPA: hypothetical protein VNE39_06545 [Planctomycetota bacterium]|nr:hypothetical protein [Planctomycetota bacterium]